MSEPRRDPAQETDASPYSRPPQRGSTPTSTATQNAIVAGVAGLAGAVALGGFLAYRSLVAEPRPAPLMAEPAAVETAPLPPPQNAPRPVEQPPQPSPQPATAPFALDPKAKLKSCRPYAGFVADQQNPAVSESALAEEAACLCSLAGGFTVRNPGGGLQVLKRVSACPTGSKPVPLEPDAKLWMGQWIDEPGHGACVCSESARSTKAVFAR